MAIFHDLLRMNTIHYSKKKGGVEQASDVPSGNEK